MKELVEIQGKLNAPKTQFNKFGCYNYRSCEDILAAVKPLLAEQKCTLTLSDSVFAVPIEESVKDTYTGTARIYIKAVATLTNSTGESITTEALAREEATKKGMDASQLTGTASSYARKYALNGLFAIDDTKDADSLNNSPEYTQPAPANSINEIKKAITAATTKAEVKSIWNNAKASLTSGTKEYNSIKELVITKGKAVNE